MNIGQKYFDSMNTDKNTPQKPNKFCGNITHARYIYILLTIYRRNVGVIEIYYATCFLWYLVAIWEYCASYRVTFNDE